MRAGQALRQQWAQEARRAERARDPIARAVDADEDRRRARRDEVLRRYGQLLRAAFARGEMDAGQVVAKYREAEERTYRRYLALSRIDHGITS